MNKKNNTIKSIYSEIRELLFKMIPERWDSIYLYASVIEDKHLSESGEMFFFYYPKSIIRKNPVNVYEVPQKFNINEQEYMSLAKRLYEWIKQLRHKCKEIDNINWSNITISIENVEFLAEYNMDDLSNSQYTADDRRIIWKYKYLKYPVEKMNRQEKSMLKRYLQEEEWGQHGTTIYSETFYQKHMHNSIQYNEEKIDEDNSLNEQNSANVNRLDSENDSNHKLKNIGQAITENRKKDITNNSKEAKRGQELQTDKKNNERVVVNQLLKYK